MYFLFFLPANVININSAERGDVNSDRMRQAHAAGQLSPGFGEATHF